MSAMAHHQVTDRATIFVHHGISGSRHGAACRVRRSEGDPALHLSSEVKFALEKESMARTKVADADAARHFGVSEPAVHQRLKRMRELTSRVMALEKAGPVVEEKLSATARLEHVQQVIDEQLAWALTQTRHEGADRPAVIDVLLKLCSEVRHQLGLQLEISRTLVDLRILKEFQETVLDAIREESPDTARRIVTRVKERRALRPSADLPSLTRGVSDGPLARSPG
jgi:hypothetical protein